MFRRTHHSRTRRAQLLAGSALTIAVVTGSAVTGRAEASAPPVQCGTVVTTDVRLTADLVDCPEYGIVIGAPGVTIDLNGHTVDGTGIFESLSGIYNDSHAAVTVKNGRITDFSRGVDAYDAHASRVAGLDVSRTIHGIDVNESTDVVVEQSVLHDNRTAVVLLRSDRATVRWNVVSDNDTDGLNDRDSTGSRFAHNLVARNAHEGFSLSSSHDAVVEGNVFFRNGIEGLHATAGERTLVRANLALGNDGDGLAADGFHSAFGGNVALANHGYGIRAEHDAVDLGRNVAHANREGNCLNLGCR